MKICPRCRQNLPDDVFGTRKSGALRAYCHLCEAAVQRAFNRKNPESRRRSAQKWKAENPEKYRRSVKNSNLRTKGFTLETYETKFLNQGGVCAICRRPPEKRQLSADHDHVSGKQRDLLCMHCNLILGHAGDNVTVLQACIDYLARHQQVILPS